MAASQSSTVTQSAVRLQQRDLLTISLLFLLAAGCYLNTLGNGFVYDDELQILQNPYVKSWHYLPQIFHTTVWSFIGDAGESNYYRPLMTLTFLGLWKVFGESPVGFHLFNILLNALVVASVFYSGRVLLRSHAAAFLAAVVFAVHPVHTETVNWIAAVPDLEATLLFVLGFFAYSSEPWGGRKAQFIAVACFALALLAKEPALMLAPLLVWYEHLVRPDRNQTTFRDKVKRYLAVCLAAAAYLGLRIALFGKLAPVLQHAQISWRQASYSGFALVAQYSQLLLFGGPLSAFHVFHPSNSLGSPAVLAGAAIVFVCAATVVRTSARSPEVAFSIVWMAFTIAPVLNARWMAANVLTERYLYLPSVGFCWLVGSLLTKLLYWHNLKGQLAQANSWALGATLLVAMLLLAAGWKTWRRNEIWHDDLNLYAQTLKSDPDSYIMHMNLGTTYFTTRDFAAAEKELHRALDLKPDSANVLNALGCVYLQQGRLDDAAKALRAAIDLKPTWSDPHFNYGRVLRTQGGDEQALSEFRAAVRVGPLNAAARLNLAEELAARGQDAEAEAQYRKSIELQPTLHAQQKLAALLIKSAHDNEAADMLRKIVAEYPFDSESHVTLGALLEKAGRVEEARKEYQDTLRTDPANVHAKEGLQRLAGQ
jgi:protein O-mannosyl-transferase